jgi:membrane-associated protease RseP (regulator of RpoE activity)
MRHVWLCLFCFAFSSAFAQQDAPRAEVFGGYSYADIDTNGLTSSRQNANGWESSISGNFNKWLAAEADVAGYYKNYSAVSVTDYSYAAGPRFNFKPIFVHALIGGDHLRGSESGVSKSQDSLAGAFGGGVQAKISGPWSARASADYAFTRHNILGGPSVTQNNVRVSVGIVYSFGRTENAGVSPRHSAPTAGMKLAALGIMVSLGTNPGAEIIDEAPNSAASLAGIHVGDVINAVNGKPVGTPMELAAELANHSAGEKIRLGFLVRGQWQTETAIILP